MAENSHWHGKSIPSLTITKKGPNKKSRSHTFERNRNLISEGVKQSRQQKATILCEIEINFLNIAKNI